MIVLVLWRNHVHVTQGWQWLTHPCCGVVRNHCFHSVMTQGLRSVLKINIHSLLFDNKNFTPVPNLNTIKFIFFSFKPLSFSIKLWTHQNPYFLFLRISFLDSEPPTLLSPVVTGFTPGDPSFQSSPVSLFLVIRSEPTIGTLLPLHTYTTKGRLHNKSFFLQNLVDSVKIKVKLSLSVPIVNVIVPIPGFSSCV